MARPAHNLERVARLRCYELHIGLDAQAYNAFTQRWDELERSGERTLQVAQGD